MDENLIKDIENLLEIFKRKSSPRLSSVIDEVRGDLKYFKNKTVKDGLEEASKSY